MRFARIAVTDPTNLLEASEPSGKTSHETFRTYRSTVGVMIDSLIATKQVRCAQRYVTVFSRQGRTWECLDCSGRTQSHKFRGPHSETQIFWLFWFLTFFVHHCPLLYTQKGIVKQRKIRAKATVPHLYQTAPRPEIICRYGAVSR